MEDEILIRELLTKEEDAVKSYIEAASKMSNFKLAKVLLDIAKEERIHKGELIMLLKTIGVCDCEEIKKGEEEAINKMYSEETPVQEKIDARMSKKNIIKEIIGSWEKTGKIGNSSPDTKEEALKQAAAIAYSTKEEINEKEDFHPIRKEGNKWVLYSKHGKVLGKHDTKEEAYEQLQAVEVHMHG